MAEQLKLCSKCKVLQPLNNFHIRRKNKDGRTGWCKSCTSADKQRYLTSHPHRIWSQQTLAGHRQMGYIINISINELTELSKVSPVCNMCGKELCWTVKGRKHAHHDSPSLDRINNEKELKNNNIQIICHQCNTTKGTRTYNEFIDYCSIICKLNKRSDEK